MSTVERGASLVHRHVEVYEESWKKDHDAATQCWVTEEAIACGLFVRSLVERLEQGWRERVFRGVEEYSAATNEGYVADLQSWLRVTEAMLSRIARLEKAYGSVEGAKELRDAVVETRAQLGDWKPPRLSMAVGLREMTLTPEAAAEMDRILFEARSLPPEHVPGPRVQEISAEEFLRRIRNKPS